MAKTGRHKIKVVAKLDDHLTQKEYDYLCQNRQFNKLVSLLEMGFGNETAAILSGYGKSFVTDMKRDSIGRANHSTIEKEIVAKAQAVFVVGLDIELLINRRQEMTNKELLAVAAIKNPEDWAPRQRIEIAGTTTDDDKEFVEQLVADAMADLKKAEDSGS